MELDTVANVIWSSPARLDLQTFQLWLQGFTAKEAALRRKVDVFPEYELTGTPKRRGSLSAANPGALGPGGAVTIELLRAAAVLDDANAARERLLHCIENDTAEQYQNYEVLEPFLCEPTFSPQQLFQLQWSQLENMISLFYSFDEFFAREILGKKLAAKATRELEEIALKTQIRLSSCVRQHENIRRVYRAVFGDEEKAMTEEVKNVCSHIVRTFHIRQSLAEKYCRIIFLAKYKVETNRKKLAMLTYPDFDRFTALIIEEWVHEKTLDLDSKLMDGFRDLKTTLLNAKSFLDLYKVYVENNLAAIPDFAGDKSSKLVARIPSLLKSLCSIAAKLAKPKDVKEVFSLVCDEILSTMQKVGYSSQDWQIVFDAIRAGSNEVLLQLDLPGGQYSQIVVIWKSLLNVLLTIALEMHQKTTFISTPRGWFAAIKSSSSHELERQVSEEEPERDKDREVKTFASGDS